MRILVVEDEKKTAAFLAKGLREAGFAVDVAIDGETGLLVSGTNIEELLECMRKLACSPELRRRLGLRGRDRVLDAFTWQHGSRRLRQVHDSITAEA